MISNRFVHEIPEQISSTFDLTRLAQVFDQHHPRREENSYVHYTADPILVGMKERWPFLTTHVSLFEVLPNRRWFLHTDLSDPGPDYRQCALNICVGGEEEASRAVTKFYTATKVLEESGRYRVRVFSRADAVEIFHYQMTRPCILNVLVPHDVVRVATDPSLRRRLVSWGSTLSFEETVRQFT